MTAAEKAIDLVKKAIEADNARKYEEAIRLYLHAAEYSAHALKNEVRNDRVKESLLSKSHQCLDRVEQLKQFLAKKNPHNPTPAKEMKRGDSLDTEKDLGHSKLPPESTSYGGSTMEKGIDYVKKATEADNAGKYEEALRLYEWAVDHFLHSIKYGNHGERAKESIRSKCSTYMERAEKLKKFLSGRGKPQDSSAVKGKHEGAVGGDSQKNALEGAIVTVKPKIHWDDIGGLEAAKESLKEAINGENKPGQYILLYGCVGTGKTSLAKAVAAAGAEHTFFTISSLDLTRKWEGGSDRLIKDLFQLAREKKPSVIFIDDVESLCEHLKSEEDAARRVMVELLVQMEGVGVDNTDIIILGATSIPWGLDPALRRRFKTRIHVPLPDVDTRKRIFEIHIGDTPTDLTPADLDTLSIKTDGNSSADISIIVRKALMAPIHKVQYATHFKKVQGPSPTDPDTTVDDLLTPCGPREQGAMEMTLGEVPKNKLLEPRVTLSDFLKSMKESSPAIKAQDLKMIQDFKADFGEEDTN